MMTTLADTHQDAPVAGASQPDLLAQFIGRNVAYYQRVFAYIGEAPGFRATFNVMAFLLGPIWFAMRGLWNWVLPFVVLEIIALVPMFQGLFRDLALEEKARYESIAGILAQRRGQLDEALAGGSGNVDTLKRAVTSLEQGLEQSQATIDAISGDARVLIISGIVAILLVKVLQGVLANWMLERQFTRWLSNRSLPSGTSLLSLLCGVALVGLSYLATLVRFTASNPIETLVSFPANQALRTSVSEAIKGAIGSLAVAWGDAFDQITYAIRSLLDTLETFFVTTPWMVIMTFVIVLAWRSAGSRVAIFTGAGLAYLGFLGFWEKAMSTVSLLGAAASISILFGIPLGVLCARKPRVFAFVRPVLDFMQTMPSFVYLIPVIAFFGTGKPAGIIATIVFGSPPVVRLTVLGLRGVPDTVREAAIAFGASPLYLLFKVDLPLAAPSIMAGINQTIMLSLSMVVIASLIGAQGLGENVLEALQYASEGEGILAGLAILFCAMILDRIIQGQRR